MLLVSIPFKREGLPEPRSSVSQVKKSLFVSIPFKREGLPEQKADAALGEILAVCFNSLQTGRTS